MAEISRQGEPDAQPISKQAVSKWESDENTPSLAQFRAICLVLDVDAHDMLFGDDDQQDLVQALSDLTDTERRLVTEQIRQALSKIRQKR